eukprot:CAMPEP_0182591196 /NCGR_PEP_ID=MMETSP1324-20130603/73214_1 /TAXON_ID=236786 /ORGANISM="Florenciella sp., Strain RCC1587" /LENGTH=50 /DNA_ID=CAMNT_0024808469 /DNA_START=88 /DNA_END=240 /DNA_ORIENTATION=-
MCQSCEPPVEPSQKSNKAFHAAGPPVPKGRAPPRPPLRASFSRLASDCEV